MKDEFQHHGILGMKWGVRRTPDQLGRKQESPSFLKSRTKAPEAESSRASAKKRVSEMSNQELQSVINRINLEKNYKQAMAELNPVKRNKAISWVTKALGTVATGLVYAELRGAGQGGISRIKEYLKESYKETRRR